MILKDQAEQLRSRMSDTRLRKEPISTKIIIVCSGKGGVGKSNFSINFALRLIQHKKKVLLFDVDLGFANVDVLMGISPQRTLQDMLEKPLTIWDIMEEGPQGLSFIAGGSGFRHILRINQHQFNHFFNQLSILQGHFDYIIFDTGAGLSAESLRFMLAGDELLLVMTPEPTSITDGYAVLKMAYAHDPHLRASVVINRSSTNEEGVQTGRRFQVAVNQFIKKEVHVLGHIPDDPNVIKAVKRQIPFSIEFPHTQASVSLTHLTREFLQIPPLPAGGLKRFLLKMFHRG